jgi:hydrogenase maturation protein HypF
VETSSCGRLFDAIAAIVGLGGCVSFEGQAAIALESAASPGIDAQYGFEIGEKEPMEIDMRPALEEIVRDLSLGVDIGHISARFHNTVAAAIAEVCQRIRTRDGLDRVCLSGGVFQNIYLLERTVKALYGSGLEVFLHALVPPNDGGISLGQAVIANELLSQSE